MYIQQTLWLTNYRWDKLQNELSGLDFYTEKFEKNRIVEVE